MFAVCFADKRPCGALAAFDALEAALTAGERETPVGGEDMASKRIPELEVSTEGYV